MAMTTFTRFAVLTTVLAYLLGATASFAQGPVFDRAMTCASGDGDYGWGPHQIVVDGQGNTYVAGIFNGTIALGSTILSATQTAPDRARPSDIFLAKLDAAGTYQWAVQLGDNQAVNPSRLALDSTGNLYLTGAFTSYSLQVGASGPVLYNSSRGSEAFIAKFSGTTGQTLWARRAGGIGNEGFSALTTTPAGEVYVVGGGEAGADFGPLTLNAPTTVLAKFSSAGAWLWARPLASIPIGIGKLWVDVQGDLYLAGAFQSPGITLG